ncbi:MAG: type II secretion system protein [Pirellulales bacterium]|nr:type II secretion system protein [Pirellulales bacterium]
MQRVREREVREEGNGNTAPACGVLRGGHNRRFAAGGGFTLTEVLIVAVIIGILLALVSAAVFPALDSAKEFAIYSEAANLSMAMESFKAQYGATPPSNLNDGTAVSNFFSRAFPRFNTSTLNLAAAGANNNNFDPGNALVFWLVGFSGDPSNPLDGHSGRMSAGGGDNAFYEFDVERIAQGTSNDTLKTGVRYFPNVPGGAANANQDRAFLYWDRGAYKNASGAAQTYAADDGSSPQAYQTSALKFYSPRSFQIIQAGLDGTLMPSGGTAGLTSVDDDNIASFASGTIRDFYEKNNN